MAELDGAVAASLMLSRLGLCQTSPTVLYWLNLRPSTLARTEFGTVLLDLCKQLGVKLNPNQEFFKAVHTASMNLTAITPSFFTVDFKKDTAIRKFAAELQRRRAYDANKDPFAYLGALMPFCFQCLCPKSSDKTKHAFSGSLFFIYSTMEDGLRAILRILSTGTYINAEGGCHLFSQVYEHRLGSRFLSLDDASIQCKDNRLAYILIDWEVEESRIGGRMSRSNLQELSMRFPLWFYRRMLELGIVENDAHVTGLATPLLFIHAVI